MSSGGAHETERDGSDGRTGSRPRGHVRLRPGDRVAVIAPSGPVDPDRLAAGCEVLRGLGLDVALGKHVRDRVNLNEDRAVRDGWYRLAGTDADRAADLTDAWCDPSVRAVLCARGGYGATRLLDHLDWTALAAATGPEPKILHGSSDITALHVAFGARLGITTSFGPMSASQIVAAPAPHEDGAEALAGLRAALFGSGTIEVPGTSVVRAGHAEGPLTGGTLSLLTALLGTPHAPPPAAGKIVFLEDVTEEPYRLDRMLTQLLQSGWLEGAAGIALGSFHDCGDPDEALAVLTARLAPLGVPVLAGLPAGHGPRQLTLELGAPAVLDTGARHLLGGTG
ncbi:S66 peptidase family protein [Actinomadura rupiterrae]|uniref:S66 peptidase family protein n=1 Tax=Actinomadura rupiterrae TaxID=559627 RepID=UPI0020A33F74|nr:LD-carboxypeptidase [Actinomadura rupiterrae]MCP2341305.1 muramoyltetrapeptide carboxypeptidase [Actinomadura rupiterrae]